MKKGEGKNFHHGRMNDLAVLYGRHLSITTEFHVKQYPADSRLLSLLILLLYQIQQHAYLNLLSQARYQHEHTLEKLQVTEKIVSAMHEFFSLQGA